MQNKKTFKEYILYWAVRPLTVMKAVIYWDTKEEVDKFAIFVTIFESILLVFFAAIIAFCVRTRLDFTFNEFSQTLIFCLEGAPILGIFLIMPIIIILYILKKMFRK